MTTDPAPVVAPQLHTYPDRARQFCRTGIHVCIPAVTLTYDNGARRLHWCNEHASDADQYRPVPDQETAAWAGEPGVVAYGRRPVTPTTPARLAGEQR